MRASPTEKQAKLFLHLTLQNILKYVSPNLIVPLFLVVSKTIPKVSSVKCYKASIMVLILIIIMVLILIIKVYPVNTVKDKREPS